VIAGLPSKTALGAALYRAAHQLVDHPPILRDPLALRIVGVHGTGETSAALDRRKTASASAMRAFIAVRSRYAEDCFTQAHRRGVRQYVVLGAGLDTFAYRCGLDGVRLLEVDHPATQAWKLERLAQAGIAIPETVSHAPIDFEVEPLREGLARGGFDSSRPALVAWLGVTPYLAREAVQRTLRAVADDLAEGSEIVFDFATPPGPDPRALAARASFASRLQAVGEPLRSTFTPDGLATQMEALGLSLVELADVDRLNATYFEGREDGLRLLGGQLARASVRRAAPPP
jgi:methyltransferase (TIGR00027 family)